MALDSGPLPVAGATTVARTDFNDAMTQLDAAFPLQTVDIDDAQVTPAKLSFVPVPSGAIILWSGAIIAIPAGWVICDGTNGTPNLRNQFIIGAGDFYAVGGTGGGTEHLHAHSVTHDHDNTPGSGVTGGADFDAVQAQGQGGAKAPGDTDYATTLPPFYALAYIMKT